MRHGATPHPSLPRKGRGGSYWSISIRPPPSLRGRDGVGGVVRASSLKFATIALALLLAACQPLPQPFAEDRPPPGAPILTPKDGAGIAVQPLDGMAGPAGSGLAEAMAAAL